MQDHIFIVFVIVNDFPLCSSIIYLLISNAYLFDRAVPKMIFPMTLKAMCFFHACRLYEYCLRVRLFNLEWVSI